MKELTEEEFLRGAESGDVLYSLEEDAERLGHEDPEELAFRAYENGDAEPGEMARVYRWERASTSDTTDPKCDAIYLAEEAIERMAQDGFVDFEDGDPELETELARAFEATLARIISKRKPWQCDCVGYRDVKVPSDA